VTNLTLVIRPRAQADIDAQTARLDETTPNVGARFLTELSYVFDRLTSFPGLGQPCRTKNHPDLRRAVLPTFPVSVFYRPTATTIEIVRVLHQARDRSRLLEET
jgi:plasmid stabilization system protein ParE